MTDTLYGADIYLNQETADIQFNYQDDFILVEARPNLTQAIYNRLQSHLGELTLHPNYGTELHTIVGRGNTTLVLNQVRQFVRKTLLQEPRIDLIETIYAEFTPGSNNTMIDVNITVKPIGSTETLNLIYPVMFE